MDWYVEWIKTQQELSEASKADHYWKTLPNDLRSRMPAAVYREKRAAALKRLRRADAACYGMVKTRRVGGMSGVSFAAALGPVSDPGNPLFA